MKSLFAALFILTISCQVKEQKQVQELKWKVDSLTPATKEEEKLGQTSDQLSVYAFCVISYDYWYYDGPTFDGTPTKKHTTKQIKISGIQLIGHGEDAKHMFKDQCLANWRNSQPSYEINHTKLTGSVVHSYPSYTLASQEREKLMY